MSEKKELFKEARVKYEAVFDLKELYKHAHDWLAWRKYDITEKKYQEKVKPGPAKDIEILWAATRDIDEYTRFEIDVKWQVFNMIDVEAIQAGKKVKMNQGEVNAYVTAWLVLDWQDKWEEKIMFKFLKSFYEKYLYKSTLETLKGELWKEGWEFYNEIKAFLNLYKYK